ncbi:MAG: hypothetical protein A2648_01545 [Candidatus Lloydbacteria bacterium RIFCSPHIGHO2_01_FULL_41_20]|uniref:Uncharacterized protein n=1 Tax=Candidatus Lloydbacteria bacterium RIFCSPHIGHO2_01_FULL_41_20 TaxID=1798657 RepID=A0A1G2CV02_9BACT|nr:MAG: hypothetical protein A2648_01545 [Candidatus Lloydbacteria bacterium RIFCSPHIGHO2_01_FULL_41_20]
MKKYGKELKESQLQITLSDFLESFNKNMPKNFPRASSALLQKFKETHSLLFTHGDMWSLDQHRKKIIDWLPRNTGTL